MESFKKEIVKPGNGTTYPKKGQKVQVNYTGKFADGSVFDSNKKPFIFNVGVGQVIRGWDEGVLQMTVGEKCKLTCPPEYAYGAEGYPGAIPPNSTLYFDVELVKIL